MQVRTCHTCQQKDTPLTCVHVPEVCVSDWSSVCGGVLNSPVGGNFTSPGYLVSNYSSNLNCEWLIQNPQHVNSSIVVLVEDLHLQNHQTCRADYLQFRLGENQCFMLVQIHVIDLVLNYVNHLLCLR